jgi:hypothetical protein
VSDPTILFVKPAAISDKDKRALKSAGVIVVEIDDPQNAKFVRAGVELDSGSILHAAAKAISETPHMNDVKSAFGRAICEAIKQKPRL